MPLYVKYLSNLHLSYVTQKKNWILPVSYNWIVFSEESSYSGVLPSNFLWYYICLFPANKWAIFFSILFANQEKIYPNLKQTIDILEMI